VAEVLVIGVSAVVSPALSVAIGAVDPGASAGTAILMAAGVSAVVGSPATLLLRASAAMALSETASKTARIVMSAWFFMIVPLGRSV
jgi:hypothetical protein